MQEQARQAFHAQVRSSVHLIIDASPQGEFFSQQRLQYPGISNNCHVLWYQDWPAPALHAVSTKLLSPLETNSLTLDQALTELSVDVHRTVGTLAGKFQQATRRQ